MHSYNMDINNIRKFHNQKPDLWEQALTQKDKNLAIKLMEHIRNQNISWQEACKKVEYPYINAFINGEISSHFRRVLVELKLLSIYGDHCWEQFGGKR